MRVRPQAERGRVKAVSGEYAFSFSGGALCLDFVNTMSGARARPEERLNTYLDLVSWGRQAGLLTEREAQRLGRAVRLRPADAARMLEEARALREALFRIFQAAIDRRPPSVTINPMSRVQAWSSRGQ
jgi:predicted RNA-binding Zn ribbon-like protein